jgi:hypothetical protein
VDLTVPDGVVDLETHRERTGSRRSRRTRAPTGRYGRSGAKDVGGPG